MIERLITKTCTFGDHDGGQHVPVQGHPYLTLRLGNKTLADVGWEVIRMRLILRGQGPEYPLL